MLKSTPLIGRPILKNAEKYYITKSIHSQNQHIMKKLLLLGLLMQVFLGVAQENFFSKPILWVRADSLDISQNYWRDITGHRNHLYPLDKEMPPAAELMNFNVSIPLTTENYLTASSILLAKNQVTIMVVYQIEDSIEEQAVWGLSLSKDKRVGLSSQRILSEKSNFKYTDENRQDPVINSLGQTWKNSMRSKTASADFTLGFVDTLSFRGKIAECLLFDGKLSDSTLVQYISYLAIKYGVTLYQTNYLNSRGEVIWNYTNNPLYSCSITGIGKDSGFGLHQKQTYMSNEQVVMGLGSYSATNDAHPAQIEEGDCLVWGFDSLLLDKAGTLYWENGEELTIYGNGMLQATGRAITQEPIFIQVDASGWEGDLSKYLLLIDRSGYGDFQSLYTDIYEPVFVDTNQVMYFTDVYWDRDQNGIDRFCFAFPIEDSSVLFEDVEPILSEEGKMQKEEMEKIAKLSVEEQREQSQSMTKSSIQKEGGNRYALYPNPTSGNYTLEVNYDKVSDVSVKIYYPDGKLLDAKEGKSLKDYLFKGHLPVMGQYMIEITGGGEHKIFKMIVQ